MVTYTFKCCLFYFTPMKLKRYIENIVKLEIYVIAFPLGKTIFFIIHQNIRLINLEFRLMNLLRQDNVFFLYILYY